MNGRYSFAFSSQPVAQTSSKRSARRCRRSPTVSGMQWAIPSIQWNGPGMLSRVGREAEQADHAVDVDEEDRFVCFFRHKGVAQRLLWVRHSVSRQWTSS